MTKLKKAIRNIVHSCLKLNKQESLLILIDEPNRDLGYLLLKTALRVSENVFLIEMKKIITSEKIPSLITNVLIKKANATIVATSNCYYHSKAFRSACHFGARILFLSQLSPEIIERCVNTDFNFSVEKSNRIADLFSIGKKAKLTTAAGTDITIPINRRTAVADTGLAHEPGMFATLPAGEAYISPEGGKAEGVAVIDGSLGSLGLVHEPIELRIKNGYITRILGGSEASYLRKVLKSFGTQARNLAELGVGTNPKAMITGSSCEDEKVLGTVHIAFGDPSLEGGNSYHKCHIDAIMKNPTLEIDGHLILQDGKLLI